MRLLSSMTSADLARDGGILAVPVGSTEQHGPHLPLGTDTMVAVELSCRLARRRPSVVVAPAVAYGSSGEHQGFAGTLSIGQEALEMVLVELGRSASESFEATVFVSGHGGNAQPIRRAVEALAIEGRVVSSWSPSFGGDAHAGRTETSLVLALEARAVRLERAAPGATEPLSELIGALRSGGVASVSPNGVLGDPTGARADEGERLLSEAADQLTAHVEAWAPAGTRSRR